jgi:hypothetical protein
MMKLARCEITYHYFIIKEEIVMFVALIVHSVFLALQAFIELSSRRQYEKYHTCNYKVFIILKSFEKASFN